MTEQAKYTPEKDRILTLYNIALQFQGTAGHNAIFEVKGFDSMDSGETNITELALTAELVKQRNEIVVPLTTEEDRQMILNTPKWSTFTAEVATISQAGMHEVTSKNHRYLPTFTIPAGTLRPTEDQPAPAQGMAPSF